MTKILITGATGFLGRAIVDAARTAGHHVTALNRGEAPADWADDDGITHVRLDLGDSDATDALGAQLDGVDAVIHAAASFAGDEATHARDTIGATDHLVAALEAVDTKPRLVLISSLSVYDVAGMDNNATLDDSMPLVEHPHQRDAYAAAKAAQERSIKRYDGPKQIIRPGAIFGPHRLWSAQLGFTKAGRVFCPGVDVLMPAIEVHRAAAAIVRAAASGEGADIINLIDPNPPTRGAWLAALGLRIVPVPQRLVMMVASLTGRTAAWQARFRPLKYDTGAAEALLDPTTQRPFKDQIAAAKQSEGEPS